MKVASSHLISVRYNKKEQILTITFWNDSVYEYYDVPEEKKNALIQAVSKGKYLWNNFRRVKAPYLRIS